MIKYLLNDKEHQISELDPNTTLLDYLREDLRQTGSKEGCASGDCGACTVVIGEVAANGISYKAINACITPVATLHGKQLITVEHLKEGEQLHPVQQAMVDCHGSQCGFCTPGFVMSMFAHRKSHSTAQRDEILEALGGNLCRCTGYRPIMDAAVQMFDPAGDDQFSRRETDTAAALQAIQNDDTEACLSGNKKTFFAPTTANALAQLLLDNPEARLLAGGTDLSLEFTQLLKEIDCLVYTGRVAELKRIESTEQGLLIGAAVTYSEARDSLVSLFPDLHELIDRLGSKQIRNQGTLGGNIGNASPIGDMPPVLIALNATLILRTGEQCREIPVEDYFVRYKVTAQQPGEFIEAIRIPAPSPAAAFRAYKISKRLEDDISATCGAFNLDIDNGTVVSASIAFGGMAEIPKRASHCEQALHNQPWSESTIEAAMQALASDFTPISDFRASADYRLKVSQNMLRRLFLELADPVLQMPANNLRVTRHA